MIRSDGRPHGPVRIAVDLLGGDDAPAAVVDGALRALAADPDLHLHLVGPPTPGAADEVLAVPGNADRVRLLVASQGVAMGDSPSRGVDRATTIGAAMRALALSDVEAVVSAGSSGATVTAAVSAVGRQSGVRRPALVAVLPAARGPVVLLDVGAGVQAQVSDLLAHAELGAAYARLVNGVRVPRVGLLSMGAEPGKGDRLRKSADETLRLRPPRAGIYVGLVEGNEAATGERADVIVTDGFTGNVLLKGIEAMASRFASAVPTVAPTHETLPRAGVLLGVARPVIVCHGAADGPDIASGLALAARLVRAGVIPAIAGVVSAEPATADAPAVPARSLPVGGRP